ncbi:MAG: phosphocholine cytidylyltransferase family protein [Planctomycetota bacterium]|nr:phosphocholine cytidylyltransferase family protein [Planctomycetota bacterium]
MRYSIETVRPIRTALLLAAGTGSRLSSATNGTHKCLTEVNGVPILGQQISCLSRWGFDHLYVVLGHQPQQVREFLDRSPGNLKIDYIYNPRYQTTNNITSLWLARNVIKQPFLLLECDLFFDVGQLKGMLQPDRIAVATRQPWMRGTTVTLNDSQQVTAFHLGRTAEQAPGAYKTVNIYSLSLPTWHQVGRRLDSHVSSGRVSDYYETIFRDMVAEGMLDFQAVSFDCGKWQEIDTIEDLRATEKLFGPGSALPAPEPLGSR